MQNCNCSRDQPLLMKKSVKGPSGFVYSYGYYSEQKSFFFLLAPKNQDPDFSQIFAEKINFWRHFTYFVY